MYERSCLCFYYKLIEGAKRWAIWSDVVENSCDWISPALYDHMLHTGIMSVCINDNTKIINKPIHGCQETDVLPEVMMIS